MKVIVVGQWDFSGGIAPQNVDSVTDGNSGRMNGTG